MQKEIINTDQAPAAIGAYSQAVKIGSTVYMSGQIPLDPKTMELVNDSIEVEINQVFNNLQAVAKAAGGDMGNIVKLNVFLTDLDHFSVVNEIMAEYFDQPYPTRAVIGIAELPKAARVEMDAIMVV